MTWYYNELFAPGSRLFFGSEAGIMRRNRIFLLDTVQFFVDLGQKKLLEIII